MNKKKGPKKNKHRTREQIVRDDQIITDIYLEGNGVLKIVSLFQKRAGTDYALTFQDVVQALERIRERWGKQTSDNYDKYVQRELAKLDKIEVDNWEAWEESKKDLTGTSQKTLPDGGIVTEEWTKSAGGGNPKFLDAVGKCIAQRITLMRPIWSRQQGNTGLTMQEILAIGSESQKALGPGGVVEAEYETGDDDDS